MPVELALLLYLRLVGSNGHHGKLAFPVTVTSQVDRLVEGTGFEIVRTPASLQALTQAAAQDGVVFAGAVGGGYVFPEFLPGYDAVASLAKLLELLAPVEQPLSELVAELPAPTLVHRQLPCPWGMKGLVMRVLNERFAGRDVDLTDGIKVFDAARVGPGAARPGRAVHPPLRRGGDGGGLGGARRRAARDHRGDRAGRSGRGANLKLGSRLRPPQRLKFTLDPSSETRCAWNHCPTLPRCPTTT